MNPHRLLSEQEAQAYAALFTSQMPQFEVMWIIGEEDNTGVVCITLDTTGANESVYLRSPHEVTNFLNFLKMQQSLKEE